MNKLKLVAWFLALALLLEAGARVVATFGDDGGDADQTWFTPSPSLGWVRRPGYSGTPSCSNHAEFDENGFLSNDSSQIEDRSQQRVLFIGDSNTFGFCVDPADTFVELIDDRLPGASTINAAAIGYSSYQGYKTLMEYGDTLDPDVVVVSFNYNDRRYALDLGSDSSEVFETRFKARSRLQTLERLQKSYFVRGLYVALKKTGLVPVTAGPSSIDLNEVHARVEPDSYRANLQGIIDWSRDRDVDVVLLLLGDNPARTSTLTSGIEYLRAGEFDAAIDVLRIASRDVEFGTLARKYLSEAYAAIGDIDSARETMRVAQPRFSESGGYPIYPDSVYQQVMREIAVENGVALVDGYGLLAMTPGDYIDMCHFDEQGQRRVAELLLPAISQILENRP